MDLSKRVSAVAPSATLALNQKAQEMKAAGQDVISLTAGEPDFPPPDFVLDAMRASIDAGETRYTPVAGIAELREAVAARHTINEVAFAKENVVISTGAKQSLFNAALALLNPGDEAIIVAPFWLSYRDMVRIAGGTPVIVETTESENFILSPEKLEAAITDRTRMIILNSPSNPCGAVYDTVDLGALAAVLRKHPAVTIVADEIYRNFVYDGAFASFLAAAPDLADRILVVDGVSKSYAMTGLRIGWGVGPKKLISAMTKLQGQSTSNASAPSQRAALSAITGDQSPVGRMVDAFDTRRAFVIGRLHAMPNVACFMPRGAFYAFPSVAAYVGKKLPDGSTIDDAFSFCGHLLHEHGLVVVPGGPFGSPNNLRLSFAADMDTLAKGLDRLQLALSEVA